ncbi:Holliday junction branch migration protein RuvA, partial [Candidatus Eisenbacteria bacterium]
EIGSAVEAKDQARFQSVPGIGKRTAARIVVELAGKLEGTASIDAPAGGSPASEAIDALVALGVGRTEAVQLVGAVAAGEGAPETTADLIAAALKRRR